MRTMNLLAWAVLLAAHLLLPLVQAREQPERPEARPDEHTGTLKLRSGWINTKPAPSLLPALFDFEHYKRQFGKKYGSLLEELNRKRLYMSRAVRAFVTGIKYKFYQLSHYNSVNHLSDMSEAELALMTNRAQAELDILSQLPEASTSNAWGAWGELKPEAGRWSSGSEKARDELPDFLPDQGENVEAELAELMEKHAQEAGFRELRLATLGEAAKRRVRREVGGTGRHAEVRHFSLEKLINTGDMEPIAGAPAEAVRNKPGGRITARVGVLEHQEQVETVRLAVAERGRMQKEFENYMKSLVASEKSASASASASGLAQARQKDELFYDLRQTRCLSRPRNQGKCASCYAFASIAIMEWLYCKKMGQLVEFSEQYMLDCGKHRTKTGKLLGCQGGDVEAVANFLHNFGLELRSKYPYRGQESQCPYAPEHELKKTGHVRMEIGKMVRVPIEHWAELLRHGPMYIVVQLGPGYQLAEYGGGVDQCRYCAERQGFHSMVLVGHGREHGREYWLIRNSYGVSWGELGYWKLCKQAALKFVYGHDAYMFGTTDGRNFPFKPRHTN